MLQIKSVTKAPKGHNRYCGPAALSIISGLDTAEAARVIRHISKKPAVRGTSFSHMLEALRFVGYTTSQAGIYDTRNKQANPTLAAWLEQTDATRGNKVYLVCAGWHWQVIQGSRYCCGVSKTIVSLDHPAVKRRSRVTGVWLVEAAPALAQPVPASKPKAPTNPIRAKARKLAREYGIEIEIEYGDIIVWGPEMPGWLDEEECDPFYGDHRADDWREALERVEEYVRLIERKPHWFAKEQMAA